MIELEDKRMAFDVVDQDITQLFKNDDIFYIPRYQRNYVWNELNWSQLLKDIRYCAEVTPEWSHFIGSMVFERKQKSGGFDAVNSIATTAFRRYGSPCPLM